MSRSYNVIDADGHILEPFTLWGEYLDPMYRERAPKLVKDEKGVQKLLLEEKVLGSQAGFGGIGAVGARQGTVVADGMDYNDGRKGGFDPHARIPDMDLDGIDAAFLYPSLGLFVGSIRDPAFAAAMCRAYNRWLADYCKPYPDRLFGIAMLPMQSATSVHCRAPTAPMPPKPAWLPSIFSSSRSFWMPFSSLTSLGARSRKAGSR